MQSREQLAGLIGDIYDAALDPWLWASVVERSARFVGGSSGGLFSRDIFGKISVWHDFGVSDEYKKLYCEHYWALDPLKAEYPCLRVGEIISNSTAIRQADFAATRFCHEWTRPQGFVDNVIALLEKSPTDIVGFSLHRHERDGLADGAAHQRMRLILPHLRRAVLISKAMDMRAAEAATFADTLDGLSAGLFLIDALGRIIHANAAGHAMLTAGDVLRAANGHFAVIDVEAHRSMREALDRAASGDAAIAVSGIAVPLMARSGERHVANVLPLTSGARRRAGASYAAVAAVFVHKAAVGTPSPPEIIARTFQLTPTELRVLLGIIEVGGVPETAEALGIAETTVKTHLSRLFAKTGTSRQADLVRLVAGFSNPLIG